MSQDFPASAQAVPHALPEDAVPDAADPGNPGDEAHPPVDTYHVQVHTPADADLPSGGWGPISSSQDSADEAITSMHRRREHRPTWGPLRVIRTRKTYTVVATEDADVPDADGADDSAVRRGPTRANAELYATAYLPDLAVLAYAATSPYMVRPAGMHDAILTAFEMAGWATGAAAGPSGRKEFVALTELGLVEFHKLAGIMPVQYTLMAISPVPDSSPSVWETGMGLHAAYTLWASETETSRRQGGALRFRLRTQAFPRLLTPGLPLMHKEVEALGVLPLDGGGMERLVRDGWNWED